MLSKYYSLDECSTKDEVYSYLEELQDDGKISFTIIEIDEVVKLIDNGLTQKEVKDIARFLSENDVIEYDDYQPSGYEYDEDDEDDEDMDWGSYDEENDY